MKRILIIGNSGAGKTTLANSLAGILRLPLVHLDKLYWRDGWQHVSREEFDALLSVELQKESWILDGNFDRTLPLRLRYCDTVIYLDYSPVVCLCGAVKRVLKNYGKTRPDMGDNCPEHMDLSFLRYIWGFNKKNRRSYYKMLDEAPDIDVVILHSRRQCREYLQHL